MDEIIIQVYRKTPREVRQTVNTSGIAEASQFIPVAIGLFTPWNATEQEIKEQDPKESAVSEDGQKKADIPSDGKDDAASLALVETPAQSSEVAS